MLWWLFISTFTSSLAYLPDGKEGGLVSEMFLREIVNRIGKDLPDLAYVDFPENRLPLGVRSHTRDLEEEQLFPIDYDTFGEASLHPSIRDQEFLEHSSLYGSQFVSGGAGEGKQHLGPEGALKNHQEIKTDATLPAYCNPPNPCPVGYSAEQGCIEEFENTASYSRRYQAAQDCMCDTEHMFDCPNPGESIIENPIDDFNDLQFNRFLQQMNPSLQHKSLVAKKFHQYDSKKDNPFLTGERLPVAAKKGNHVIF